MNNNTQRLIQMSVELGTASALEALGIHSGELSQNKATDVYHKWFTDAVKAGRIHPCRVEDGGRGTKYYRVVDILKLKVDDAAKAELL